MIMIRSREEKIIQLVSHIILTGVTIAIVMPFVLLFISSITEENTLIRNGYSFIPEKFSFAAYIYIFNQAGTIFRAYGITIIVTIIGTLINISISSMLAYGLSLRKLPFKRLISFYVLFTMLFNGGLVPSYLMWTGTFKITNTIWALILPNYMLSAMNIILIRTYYHSSIPEALYEAAEIDGASSFRVFLNIVLPLGKPILITMGLFAGLNYWNDWTNGLYYLRGRSGERLYSIQNLLNRMISQIQFLATNSAASSLGEEAARIPSASVRMAIAFVAMLPVLCIYPFLQKYFQEGIAMGAVKG